MVEIDLLKMTPVLNNEMTCRYILTVDVFSRFLFCKALQRNTSKDVAAALNAIFTEHGWPKIIQSDNGSEFRGEVHSMLAKQ